MAPTEGGTSWWPALDAQVRAIDLILPESEAMRWFGRERPRTIQDAVLGPLVLSPRDGWEGTVRSPVSGETMSILVARTEEGPTDADRQRLLAFRSSYPEIVPSLKAELWRLFEPSVNLPDWDGPNARTPDELWEMLQLESASIYPDKPLELLFAFRGDAWPDAMFSVAVDGVKAWGLSLDD